MSDEQINGHTMSYLFSSAQKASGQGSGRGGVLALKRKGIKHWR